MVIGATSMGTQGKVIHVKPYSGADGQDGLSPESAVKTLVKALALATADQNDIILLYSESNTAANTTDYQSATLTWNKNLVHLIGIGADAMYSQRARIGQLSTATGVSPLVNVTANACMFKNLSIFHGVDDNTSLIALRVSGKGNVFENVHIGGMGHATQVTAGATSLKLDGANENVFRKCVIGLDTTTRDNSAEGEIWLDGASLRNVFDDCLIVAFISSAGYEHVVFEDSLAIDRYVMFKNCIFYSISGNNAAPQDQIFEFKASLTQGHVILHDSVYVTDDASCVWVTSGEGSIRNTRPATEASAAGGEATIL
jgi:hypothetical protein